MTLPDMDTITRQILEAEGNLPLVAERLLGSKFKQDELLSALSADEASINAFAAKTRAYALIKIISIFSAMHVSALAQAHELDGEASMKAFLKIAEVMGAMTAPTTKNTNANINIFEYIMRSVPAPVADALREVITVNQEGEILHRTPPNAINGHTASSN